MRDYPDKATPAMMEVLGQMPWHLQSIAHALRDAGQDIPRKTEAELAAAQHWLMKFALDHGDEWRQAALEAMDALAKTAKPKEQK